MSAAFLNRFNVVNFKRFLFAATYTTVIMLFAQVKPFQFGQRMIVANRICAALESVNPNGVTLALHYAWVVSMFFFPVLFPCTRLFNVMRVSLSGFIFLSVLSFAVRWVGVPMVAAPSIIPFVDFGFIL